MAEDNNAPSAAGRVQEQSRDVQSQKQAELEDARKIAQDARAREALERQRSQELERDRSARER